MKPEDLEDFLKDDEDDGAISVDKAKASRIQVEYDESGNIKRSWEPGEEDNFVADIEKEDKEVEIPLDDEETPPIEEEVETDPEEVEEPKEEKTSRSQERIRQLANERREVEQAYKKTQAALERERQEKLSLQAAYAKNMLSSVESEMSAAEADLKRAMEDQDSELFAKAQRKLIEAQSQRILLEQALEQAEKEAKKPATTNTVDDNLPPAAQEWLSNKADYMDINKYKALPREVRKKLLPVREATYAIANELKAIGYTTDDPDFYDELDLRLSTKFDFYEELASSGIDSVDFSSIGPKKAAPSDETLKPQKKSNKEKAARVPVSASSPSNAKSSSKTSIKLHPDQMALFNSAFKPRYLAQGMTEEQALKAFINFYKEAQ